MAPGNVRAPAPDNHLVHAIADLMDVVRDLCRYAAVFRQSGRISWSDTIIEQCADLLAHRARLIEASLAIRPTSEPTTPAFPRRSKWTN